MQSSYAELAKITSLRRAELTQFIWKKYSGVVAGGLFQGMLIYPPPYWGNDDICPMVLGTYEEELHQYIQKWIGRQYDCIINIGSGDGYYVVALGRLFPTIPIYAFEIDETRHPRLTQNIDINRVADRVEQLGAGTPDALMTLLNKHPRSLCFMDCEGAERDLISEATIATLAKSDIIVECHEFLETGITDLVRDVLNTTHQVTLVDLGGRNPQLCPAMRPAAEIDRWIAVSENRPSEMCWLVAEPKTTVAPKAGKRKR